MKKYSFYILASICIAIFISSCSNFLEVDIPKDQIDNNKIYHDDRTATAAVVNIYTMLRNTGFLNGSREGVGYLMGCYTDELKVLNTQDVNYRLFYNGTVLSTNAAVKNIWNSTYQQIYAINNTVEGLEKSTTLTVGIENQLLGEVIAVRALLHFYLAMTFGDIPYITTTSYNTNSKVTKKSTDVVINTAIQELLKAERLLLDSYPTSEKIRINKSTVQGLLARIFLYQGNWQMAAQYAETLMSNTKYDLESFEKIFFKESKSAIWQLKPDANGKNTLEGTSYSFVSLPAKEAVVTQELYNIFKSNDLRKELWFKIIGNASTDNIHAYKYKQRGATGTTSLEYSIVLRIEEMYLIAAEAQAQLGNFTLATGYLNEIQKRATTDLDILDNTNYALAISKERQRELFCEFGHRFYDLKRMKLMGELSSVKPFWNANFEKLPLPEIELQLNKNLLPQNKGY